MTKTYQVIKGTKIPISRCSGILENRMQCTRAGDVQVSFSEEVEKDKKKLVNTVIYQLCSRHAIVEQQQDKAAEVVVVSPVSTTTGTGPVASKK